jgi:hypothetical protein
MDKKPISPTAHGIIDYGSVGLMLVAPSLLGLKGAARRLSYLFGLSYAVISALTDYKLALRRAIPFRAHGVIEIASAPMLVLLPFLFRAFRNKGARNYYLALAATVATVYTLTDWDADTDDPEIVE